MVDPLTLSVREAAAKLGIGKAALYGAIHQGIVPALRIGRKPHIRIPRQIIERLLADPSLWGQVVGVAEK